MLSLANRTDGYNEEILEFLKPLLSSISQFIIAVRNNRLHQEHEAKLKHQAKHTQAILNEAFDAIITVNKLGTPLTSISASLAIMESGSVGELPEQIKNFVRIAHQNSLRLQLLINDLPDVERLLTNSIQFDIKALEVKPLLAATLQINQYYAEISGQL